MSTMVRDERGQGILEFLAVIPVFLLVFGMLILFGKLWYAHVVAEEAAFDCTRTAIEALEQGQGMWQGQSAARMTVAQSLLSNPQQVTVRIVPLADWERGGWVMCEVAYAVDLRSVPFARWIHPNPVFAVRAHYWGRVQEYKSSW